MNTKLLTMSAMMAGGLLQACAGGQITDGSGNTITGSGNSNLVVTFQDNSGDVYSTGVNTGGVFAYDTYQPASANNNPVALVGGPFTLTVSAKDGTSGQTSLPFNVTYNNATCLDYFNLKQTDKTCAIFQAELLGAAGTPPAASAGSAYGYTTTIVPMSTQQWCAQAVAGFGVANMSATATDSYNDIRFQISSAMPNVAWGWKTTKVTPSPYTPANVAVDASGTIPANFSGGWGNGEAGGFVDVAEFFQGPDFTLYPDTTYYISFFPGGLSSSCAPVTVPFQTTFDPTPPCVIDHDCPVDPGAGGDGGDGSCDPGIDCCANGYCSDPDQGGECDPKSQVCGGAGGNGG